MENQSFYLFTKLYDSIIGNSYDYELMYKDLKNIYFLYNLSDYNNKNLSEFQSMSKFFIDNFDYIKNEEYLIDVELLNKK